MKLNNIQIIVLLIAGAAIVIYFYKKNSKDKESGYTRNNPLKDCINRCLGSGKPMEYCTASF